MYELPNGKFKNINSYNIGNQIYSKLEFNHFNLFRKLLPLNIHLFICWNTNLQLVEIRISNHLRLGLRLRVTRFKREIKLISICTSDYSCSTIVFVTLDVQFVDNTPQLMIVRINYHRVVVVVNV